MDTSALMSCTDLGKCEITNYPISCLFSVSLPDIFSIHLRFSFSAMSALSVSPTDGASVSGYVAVKTPNYCLIKFQE